MEEEASLSGERFLRRAGREAEPQQHEHREGSRELDGRETERRLSEDVADDDREQLRVRERTRRVLAEEEEDRLAPSREAAERGVEAMAAMSRMPGKLVTAVPAETAASDELICVMVWSIVAIGHLARAADVSAIDGATLERRTIRFGTPQLGSETFAPANFPPAKFPPAKFPQADLAIA